MPGQTAWDNARAAFDSENYTEAGLFSAQMLGEQALAVATLGQGSAALKSASSSSLLFKEYSVAKAFGPSRSIFGRERLGGSSLFNINSNDVLRIGWGWRGSATTGTHVFRISGDWVRRIGVESGHIDLFTWP